MKWLFPIILGAILPLSSFAQVQDSIELKSVIVSAEKPSGIPALKSRELDSATLQLNQVQNLGTLLQNNSSVNIKSYGSNGIQTVTFRGMSASHTKIYVNGLDISPGSLGQSDLSIIPTFLFSGVSVKYGNTAFTEGPGAIGGGVMLSTNQGKLNAGTSLKAGFSIGSFGKKIFIAEHGFKSNNWESTTRYIYQTAENDYGYRNIAQDGSPTVSQTHANNSLHGFTHSANWTVNKANKLTFMFLGTVANRNLPSLMTDTKESQQSQKDELINTQLGWVNYGRKSKSNLVVGYSWSALNYEDNAANINSTTKNNRFQLREDYTYNLNQKWALNSTAILDYSTAINPNYTGNNYRAQGSVLVGMNGHLSNKWEVGAFIQPTVNNLDFVWLPMASVAFLPKGNRHMIFGVNVAQNSHFPTLNDLYWYPGGSPNLKPEMATNGELNFHVDGKIKKDLRWGFDAAGFVGNVDNWILWQPTDKAYWEAQNIKSVQHSGAEAFVGLHQNWVNWKLNFSGSYQYVKAINKGVENESLNKQLIYTPEHSANWLVGTNYKNIGLNVNYSYTGKRFTATDNSSYLPAYDIVNLTATYHLKLKVKHVFDFQFDVFNVLGKEYMSVAWRAMPGVNYLLTVRYGLN